jgi:hypothetical protein
MNNFYGSRALFADHQGVIKYLKDRGAKGGIFQKGANANTALHAEDNIIAAIGELNLPSGSTVVVGVSLRICPRCMTMGTTLSNGGLEVVQNGVRIIIASP